MKKNIVFYIFFNKKVTCYIPLPLIEVRYPIYVGFLGNSVEGAAQLILAMKKRRKLNTKTLIQIRKIC